MQTFETDDRLLKIELDPDGTMFFIASADRIRFCTNADFMTIIVDAENEMFYINFTNAAATKLHLKSAKEAKEIADFLNVELCDLYQFA